MCFFFAHCLTHTQRALLQMAPLFSSPAATRRLVSMLRARSRKLLEARLAKQRKRALSLFLFTFIKVFALPGCDLATYEGVVKCASSLKEALVKHRGVAALDCLINNR